MSTPCCPARPTNAALLATLLQKLSDDAPVLPARLAERLPVHGPVTLGVRVGSAQDYRALDRGWALDISGQGLALLLEHELPVNLEMFVNLEALTQQACILPVRIVYSRQLLPGAHRIGAAFLLEQ